MTNRLYYGDNLDWLCNEKAFPDASVDLVYLDPPFNSNATYSQLFKSPDGKTADSQIEAFEDTWNWGTSAEAAYDRVLKGTNTDVAQLLQAMRGFLHDNALMAPQARFGLRRDPRCETDCRLRGKLPWTCDIGKIHTEHAC